MLLDVFTEREVEKIFPDIFSHDNPAVNGMTILLGILMLFEAMELHTYYYYK